MHYSSDSDEHKESYSVHLSEGKGIIDITTSPRCYMFMCMETEYQVLTVFKDIRAYCFYAALLRTQILIPRQASSTHAKY